MNQGTEDKSASPAQRTDRSPPFWWRPVSQFGRVPVSSTPSVAGIGQPHQDSAAPFWGLVAFTVILFISPQSFLPVLAPLRIAMIAAVVAVIAYLADRLSRHRPILEFNRETVIVACLLGWAILTLPLSYWPGGSIAALTNLYLKTLIVFWLLSHVVNTLPRLQLIAWALSLMAVPLALAGLANYMTGNYMQAGFAPHESRILGYDAPLTGNPNDLALTLNLILPLSTALFLGSRNAAARMVLLTCIGLGAIAIIATFSRAGFLTLAITFVTYLWALYRRHERHWAILAIILVVAALPFIPEGYMDRLSTITDIDADPTGSAQARWGDTLAALQYVAFNPVVGAGLGMDTLALNEVRGPVWKEIHNVYLQYAVDLGIPGLILFLMLVVGSIKSAREAQRRSTHEPSSKNLYYLAEGIRISLVAFAVAGAFHPVGYHFYFYYIAGLALAARAISVAAAKQVDGVQSGSAPVTMKVVFPGNS